MMAIGDVVQLMPGSIGGGHVRRPFKCHQIDPARDLPVGFELTAEQVLAMKNRRALVERGWIEVYAKSRRQIHPPAERVVGSERHVVQVGFGRHIYYDVIEGVKVNDAPLTKDEANAMAGKPVEAAA